MTEEKCGKKYLLKNRPQGLQLSGTNLVETEFLMPDKALPLLVRPVTPELDLCSWAEKHREFINQQLYTHGALLFRGFNISNNETFERFMHTLSTTWASYREAATPRSPVSENISTSTEYPASEAIYLHNENSHCTSWPLKIGFFCVTPAQSGGETPIADCRRIFQRLDPSLRETFSKKQIMYVRNFGDGLGIPWQTVFQTTQPEVVEEYCRLNDMQVEWKGDGRLRVRYIRPAIARHPHTQEMIWFNHATFFHASTLPPAILAALSEQMPEEDFPYNTYYGDGTPIEKNVLEQLHAAYDHERMRFPWQQYDVLLLDNMLVAHGREPFTGERKVLVGMVDPVMTR